jgi:hypothetical protein
MSFRVVDFTDAELTGLLEEIRSLLVHRPFLFRVSIAIDSEDGMLRIKPNERSWGPPMGKPRPTD